MKRWLAGWLGWLAGWLANVSKRFILVRDKSGARAQARAFPLGPILKCGEEVKAECEQWFGVIGRRISVRDVASRVWQRKWAAAI